MTKVLTNTEARAGTRPQAMLWVLIVSLILAIIAGLLLTVDWINLPWSRKPLAWDARHDASPRLCRTSIGDGPPVGGGGNGRHG